MQGLKEQKRGRAKDTGRILTEAQETRVKLDIVDRTPDQEHRVTCLGISGPAELEKLASSNLRRV